EKDSSKPAVPPSTRQAKDGQPSDTQPSDAAKPVATETTASPAEAAAQDILALAEAGIAVAAGVAEPATAEKTEKTEKTDTPVDEAAKGSDETVAVVATD